ncbi:hypothetical protein SAMN05446037_1002106 [Anaerovirgula multivorans]|uniref:Uncharacterized protein n=1 Tax=Anaerovirgula multivorans TaxID=312168 RepID=A0A239AL52_9FIRM|nr:hypothetical protein [Anaerovirgula multivorans]SNR96062.1 hypothetical protein SAMN05446037_1002106 [Anaerovirgula multivorans]
MGIWVRSQDRKCLKQCNNLFVLGKSVCEDDYKNEDIQPYLVLGEYATKERAMEVLETIQLLIETGVKSIKMPKE